MKIKIVKDLSINHAGFTFRKGVAEVPEGEEEKARRVARLLNYEIVEDTPKKARTSKAKAKTVAPKEESTEAKK